MRAKLSCWLKTPEWVFFSGPTKYPVLGPTTRRLDVPPVRFTISHEAIGKAGPSGPCSIFTAAAITVLYYYLPDDVTPLLKILQRLPRHLLKTKVPQWPPGPCAWWPLIPPSSTSAHSAHATLASLLSLKCARPSPSSRQAHSGSPAWSTFSQVPHGFSFSSFGRWLRCHDFSEGFPNYAVVYTLSPLL